MIITLLILGALFIGAGSFTAGVILSERVLDRLMPATGTHCVPVPRAEPAVPQPRHAPSLLAIEPPAPVRVRADLPVTRRRAEGDPFTGTQPALTDEVLSEYKAAADERQRRTDWAAMQLAALGQNATPEAVAEVLAGMRGEYHASYQAERGNYGTRPVAEVLRAEVGS